MDNRLVRPIGQKQAAEDFVNGLNLLPYPSTNDLDSENIDILNNSQGYIYFLFFEIDGKCYYKIGKTLTEYSRIKKISSNAGWKLDRELSFCLNVPNNKGKLSLSRVESFFHMTHSFARANKELFHGVDGETELFNFGGCMLQFSALKGDVERFQFTSPEFQLFKIPEEPVNQQALNSKNECCDVLDNPDAGKIESYLLSIFSHVFNLMQEVSTFEEVIIRLDFSYIVVPQINKYNNNFEKMFANFKNEFCKEKSLQNLVNIIFQGEELYNYCYRHSNKNERELVIKGSFGYKLLMGKIMNSLFLYYGNKLLDICDRRFNTISCVDKILTFDYDLDVDGKLIDARLIRAEKLEKVFNSIERGKISILPDEMFFGDFYE